MRSERLLATPLHDDGAQVKFASGPTFFYFYFLLFVPAD
jgi:hypothetical protein